MPSSSWIERKIIMFLVMIGLLQMGHVIETIFMLKFEICFNDLIIYSKD